LYAYETWSLTLKEERRVIAFGNRLLRRIFGPKRDEVIRSSRKLHNEEFYNLYTSSNIIKTVNSRNVRLVGHVARKGENAYRILWKARMKQTLGRRRYKWEYNIETDL
jgi:hypothetical protein